MRGLNLTAPEYDADKSAATAAQGGDGDEDEVQVDAGDKAALEAELKAANVGSLIACTAHDFEKDDDDNFHIDYLTIATNLRSWNYNIKQSQRSGVKVIAGRIIPALATTTAMVCGLVDIEFCKLVLGLQNLGNSKFLQSNINLATGSEAFSVFNPNQPEEATNLNKSNLATFPSFTTWDRLDYHGDLTGAELAAQLGRDFGVIVSNLAGETSYNPAKSVALWKEGEAGGATLSATFLEKFATGAEEKDRSAQGKKAAMAVMKMFAKEPLEGVEVNVAPHDEYAYQVRMQGPAGTPYEGGVFLLDIKLPIEYPQKAPTLSFVTPIEHCNISDGVPCPGLLSLSADRWSPAMNVHSVMRQLDQLLKDQSKGDALRPELASMDDAAFYALAQEATAKYAVPEQEFPPAPPKKVAEKKQVWAHNYLVLKGDFLNDAGEQAFLPRIKLTFGSGGDSAIQALQDENEALKAELEQLKKGGAGGGGGAVAMEKCDAGVEAAVMAMELELDDFGKVTPTTCYKVPAERVGVLVSVAPSLTPANAVAVTCTTSDGEVVETIVNAESMEQCLFTDPIMYTEGPIANLVEAQFEPEGPWVLSRATVEGVEGEKATLFST